MAEYRISYRNEFIITVEAVSELQAFSYASFLHNVVKIEPDPLCEHLDSGSMEIEEDDDD